VKKRRDGGQERNQFRADTPPENPRLKREQRRGGKDKNTKKKRERDRGTAVSKTFKGGKSEGKKKDESKGGGGLVFHQRLDLKS